jgi:stringent starvation protein B
MINAFESSSTRPYLIRALYEWCADNGFTPYVAVQVDDTVQVPREYVKNGEIVLNISYDATSSLKLGNEFIEFKARFAGTAREIIVPVSRVIAIYARENGQGMAFPMSIPAQTGASLAGLTTTSEPVDGATPGAEGDLGRVVHLVMDEEAEEPDETGSLPENPEEPPRPPAPAGGSPRPSLKRVK